MKLNPTLKLIMQVLVPVAIGIGVVVFMMGKEFSLSQFERIPLTWHTLLAIFLACICMVGREWGMMWRFRVLTDRFLSWKSAFKVTMMCEFTSAVTPTSAGGSALSMIFLNREGLSLGRATSLTMVTLMLDQLFMTLMCPLVFLCIPYASLLGFSDTSLSSGLTLFFWIVYAGIVAVTVLLYLGALVMPHKIAVGINRLFSVLILRRWKSKADETGKNMIATGEDLRTRRLRWWAEAFGATAFTWISRFLVVNALFIGFSPYASQLIVFGRQFVVWTILTVSPTPGGSGVSEWLFSNYYGDLINDASMVLVIAVLWRIITYYVYLLIGVFMVPHWLRTGGKRH
ncbi:MAG: flippase-like domain-containing protein [Paramuribaculum sp.]|nr:flippase-like domain-containing protein [Paramuribaculum sp.]